MGAVVEVPHVLSYPVARKTVAREALTCGNAAVRHTFANSIYYICDPVDVTAGKVAVLRSCSAARKMQKEYGYGWDICRTSKGGFTHSMPCPYRAHAVPLPCRALIHTCHAAPLPCSNSTVSFVKVRVVAGNIRTASPTV
jgi:hypothetical protein